VRKFKSDFSWVAAIAATIGVPVMLSMLSSTKVSVDEQQVIKETADICAMKTIPPLAMPMTVAAPNADIPVILYHHIENTDKPSHEVTPISKFHEQMQWLHDTGYKTITVAMMDAYMKGEPVKLPEKPVMITFDDGWKDNIVAAKYLDQLGLGAVFYIISGTMKDPQYMSEEDVKWISSRPEFEIGSHTHDHFGKFASDMTKLDTCTVAKELVTSKHVLEKLTGKPVTSLAWPYGYSNPKMIYVASRLGYTSTMNINIGALNVPGNSPLFAKRATMNGACTIDDLKKVLINEEQHCI
jgi:peptidoglycan/xylan/chitin deacetylase (PgdA/CDA1 family)